MEAVRIYLYAPRLDPHPVLPRVLTPTRSVPLSRARTARLRDIQVSPIAGREGPIRHTILISYIKQQLEISSTTSAAG
jgi:hypothetical protein